MFFSGVDIANLGNRLENNGLDLGKLAPLYSLPMKESYRTDHRELSTFP